MSIQCSQCNATFPHGNEYRVHWEEAHLNYALEQLKINRVTTEESLP